MQIHSVILFTIILIVEIYFIDIDPNLEDNNVTVSNGAIHKTRNFRLLNYCDIFIEYNLSLECHFHYIIHDFVLFWLASDSYAIIQWVFWHFWTHWETNNIFLTSTILFTLCFNTNLVVLFLPLDVSVWFITYKVYLAPYLLFQYFCRLADCAYSFTRSFRTWCFELQVAYHWNL